MAAEFKMRAEVFLDPSFAIALSVSNDAYHARAVDLADEMEQSKIRFVTTHAVLLEIGNALAKQRYRAAAVKLLQALQGDASVEIIPVTEYIYAKAFQLYHERPDKEWGLTDCISFIVMQDRNISEALTTDQHFEQAGFDVLLKKD